MKNKQVLLFIATALSLVTACKKAADFDSSPARSFRPVPNGALVADSNTITANWYKIKDITSYTAQISKDSFKTTLRSVDLIDTGTYSFKGLDFNKLYQVRVKANAADTNFSSKWSDLGAVKTGSSILKVPVSAEITDVAVKVSWTTKGAPVSSIKILKTDSSVVTTAALTPTDITNEFKIIGGLNPSTKYIIVLYSGTDARGYADFTTNAALTGIDLRGFTGRPSVLADTIPIIPDGSTVILKRGEIYTIATALNLSKSITIISGPDLATPGQAVISMPANFNIASGATINSIIFQDVTLRGTDYTAKYVFNINVACTINQMSFIGCKGEIFRGLVRTQAQPAIINNFLVDNCILDSLSNYGVLTVDVNTSKADNIIIRNSTIYKAEKIIVSKNNSTSVLIENCTINEAPTTSSYYVAYTTSPTNVVTNGITINNCIFGIGKLTLTGPASIRGVQAGAATTINGSTNYRTSDQVSAGNDVPSLTTYTRPVAQLFVDPANGNYKIADVTFPGKSNTGDPRWRL
jgi:hypothetical protein